VLGYLAECTPFQVNPMVKSGNFLTPEIHTN